MTEREWLNDNKLSLDIWTNKYKFQDETFEEWLNRVSGGNNDIRELIKSKKFLFGGRILANRGLDKLGKKITLSNCYVIPMPEDNLESIFDCASKLARTYSFGGGCGIDVSKLRPKGAAVNNAAKSTSGSISFMDFFSYVTGLIGQEGRRGALMISIDCKHPDLEEFINLKSDLDICTKANISVRVSDEFMLAVVNDKDWKLEFDNGTQKITKTVKAKSILRLLAQRNWEMAEPGILYWDTITSYNMLDKDPNFKYEGVNPCAEEPLPAGGSCLLGSINLAEFVINPFSANSAIDFKELEKSVDIAVRALNEVLLEGLPLHPLQVQRDSVRNWRQIGLGTFGLGDFLIKLGATYGSNKSLDIIGQTFELIARTAIRTSLQLAKEHGAYPACNKEALANSKFIHTVCTKEVIDEIREYGLFNSQLLTCAPTGSIATMLGVSSGVEPNFALSYNRRTVSLNKEETTYKVDADIVKQYREATSNDGKLPEYFVTSANINWKDRLKVQSALQLYIDASISSTCNLPESTTVDDVFNLYVEAWRYGLKGVTIWRDNCQRQGILSTKDNTSKEEDGTPKRGEIIKAGNDCIGLKRTLITGCGSLHCEAFFEPNTGELREIYLSKGSTGGCTNFMIGLSRMISLSARGGIGIDRILDQLKSCGVCPSYAVRSATKKDTSKGSCCPVAVGNALKEMYEEMQEIICKCKDTENKKKEIVLEVSSLEECPNCHEKTLTHQGGCLQCTACGYSKCN